MFRDFINDGYITSAGVVWSLAIFIYACETVGGMESVALTDAVQCCFLMLSFISTYFLIEYKYGGFLGFFGGPESPQSCEAYQTKNTTWPEEPPTYGLTTLVEPPSHWSNGSHYVNTYTQPEGLGFFGQWTAHPDHAAREDLATIAPIAAAVFSEPVLEAFNMTQYGCVHYVNDWWLKYPPHMFGMFHWWFPLGALPLGMTPAGIHRAMISKSDDSFRRALAPVHYYPWFFIMPGILMGVAVATIHPDMTEENGAFTAMVDIFVQAGGIYGVFGTVLIVSCIASFMSTADSFILALANQATEDFWVGWLQKYCPEHLVGGRNMQNLIVGKLMSFLCLITSVSVALYTDVNFFELLNYGFCAIWTLIFPTIMGALFTGLKVKNTPSWPRSWANFSHLSLYSHRNAWANLHILGQPNNFLARSRRRSSSLGPSSPRSRSGMRSTSTSTKAGSPRAGRPPPRLLGCSPRAS